MSENTERHQDWCRHWDDGLCTCGGIESAEQTALRRDNPYKMLEWCTDEDGGIVVRIHRDIFTSANAALLSDELIRLLVPREGASDLPKPAMIERNPYTGVGELHWFAQHQMLTAYEAGHRAGLAKAAAICEALRGDLPDGSATQEQCAAVIRKGG